MMSFFPNLSASVPPNGEIIIWASAKTATSIPRSLLLTLNLSNRLEELESQDQYLERQEIY